MPQTMHTKAYLESKLYKVYSKACLKDKPLGFLSLAKPCGAQCSPRCSWCVLHRRGSTNNQPAEA